MTAGPTKLTLFGKSLEEYAEGELDRALREVYGDPNSTVAQFNSNTELTLTDLFCGAGGSTSGAIQVPGIRAVMAINHWDKAVWNHWHNHQQTDHDCADISKAEPRRYPRTDILWGSPECTNHSIAGRGRLSQDETATKSRATMWDLLRFTEFHKYRAIIFENVPDVMRWELLPAWLMAWDNLGYVVQWVFVNSMHAQGTGEPAPQSRNRAYAVITRKGDRRPDVEKWTRPWAHCPNCDRTVQCVQHWKPGKSWGTYGKQYEWRCPRWAKCHQTLQPATLPAAAAIDWSLPATRIGDRTRPLSPKTMARIEEGLSRYFGPMLVPAGGTWNDTAYSVADVMRTRTTRENEGLLIPVEGREGKIAHPTTEPMRTQTGRRETGLLIPYYGRSPAGTTDQPHRTFTGTDRFAFVVPLRNHNNVKSVQHPFDTFAASGNHHGLAMPETPAVEDCAFRMLDPEEVLSGMAFPRTYELIGSKRDRVRLAGNAVCPPNARDLVAAVSEALS
ncbi:DNA cytosine methyltransferase [Nocardia sp. NPDC058058]|uniref:DNA cytosine methyltransferase n=1 Tax=Nocardia sp. NPDC058058 TaxID=3346317 RepID=UPI0036D85846